jgi:hypothetical protein
VSQQTTSAARPTGPARPRPGGLPLDRERLRDEVRARFRMPGRYDPATRLRRLAGVSVWAALLGFCGLVAGLRAVVGLFTSVPLWYLPTFIVIGLFGLACTVGAFASVHRRRTPWVLLVVATLTLVLAFVVNSLA